MIDDNDDAPAPGTPAAPAPAAPAIPAAPAAPVDTRSAVERASDEARARIAAGGSADPATVKKPTPRDEDTGKFTDQPKRRLPEPKPEGDTSTDPAHAEAEPEGGPDAGEPEGGEPEGGEPKPGAEAADGQPEPEGDGEPEFVEIDIPGRRDGEAVKFKFAPDEAEDIQRLVNGYKRAEVVQAERARIEARAAEIEDWQEEVELDPASAVARTLGNDPAAMEQLALTILADPSVWQRVKDRVLGWEAPLQFELDAAKLQVAAANRREDVREMAVERRVVSRNLAQVQAAVGALIPSDKLSEDQATTFYRDAMRDLKEHAERQNLLTLDPRDIPLILATSGRLRAYGIDAVKAAEIVQEALSGTRREAKPGGSQPPSKKTPAPPAGSPPPAKRGKDFVAGAQKRKVAAATPGVGAGSPSTAVTPPPGQSIEERTAWHRTQQQKGRTLTR